jgi:hypothetical protein
MDVRVPFSVLLAAFGASAVVTLPDAEPVTATVVWMPPSPDLVPAGLELQAVQVRRVLAIPRATVPSVPRKTTVVVPEIDGGSPRAFMVDAIEREEPDHVCVVLVPA